MDDLLTTIESEVLNFARWYERYPRKKAKRDAEKAYEQIRREVGAEHLQAAVGAFRALWDDHTKKMNTKERNAAKIFCPYPASWLRSGSYEDEEITEYLSRPAKPDVIVINKGSPGYKEWTGYDPRLKTYGNCIVVPAPLPPKGET